MSLNEYAAWAAIVSLLIVAVTVFFQSVRWATENKDVYRNKIAPSLSYLIIFVAIVVAWFGVIFAIDKIEDFSSSLTTINSEEAEKLISEIESTLSTLGVIKIILTTCNIFYFFICFVGVLSSLGWLDSKK